jgi:hypothetical protein
VKERATERQVRDFLRLLDLTTTWLDEHFGADVPGVGDKAKELAATLRRYLRHCRRAAPDSSWAELLRRRDKIQAACIALWQSRDLI